MTYLTDTNRAPARLELVKAYAQAQGLYRTKSTPDPIFTDVLKLELASIEPSLAGPKRPQDRVALKEVKASFIHAMDKEFNKGSDGGGKEVFEMHPSIATNPMDKDFNKAGAKGRFPVDDDTIDFLTKTARKADRVALVKAYAKAQGMYRTKTTSSASSVWKSPCERV